MIFADTDSGSIAEARDTEKAAPSHGLRVRLFPFRDGRSLEEAFTGIQRERTELMIVVSGSLSLTFRKQVASFGAKARIAFISDHRVWAEAGAVLSYGPDGMAVLKRAAAYVHKILNGAKASDLRLSSR